MSPSPSHKTVDTFAICGWLGVPPDQWPPDHYTLLGLRPGESSVERIEQQIQQLLERVRRYQLTNPEAATEAMNRLAQAFVCLTDAQAKRAYDCLLFGPPAAPEPPPRPEAAPRPNGLPEPIVPAARPADTQPLSRRDTDTSPAYQPTLLDLTPPDPPEVPDLLPADEEEAVDPELLALVEEEVRAEEKRAAALAALAPPNEPPALPLPAVLDRPPEPLEPFLKAAQSSRVARRGLGTKRALYYRISRTRALLRVWDQAGKFLNEPSRRLRRPSEARELLEQLASIRRLLESFPPLLGEAGQPGYLVMALARQQIVVPTFQTLLPSQREALARDWSQAQKLLATHKDFLRQELRVLRRKTAVGRAVRALSAFLDEHPGGFLVLLGLLALAVALWREYL
ncbi:MAG: hypothetical protein HYS12_16275 [Planctomycetes bacterium]|nr:hypothetical protein [Planctomycetota bacterium]